MKQLVLYPAGDRLVRDPDTFDSLPVTGEAKPLNSYWLRRIECGDVTDAPAGSAGTKNKTSSEK